MCELTPCNANAEQTKDLVKDVREWDYRASVFDPSKKYSVVIYTDGRWQIMPADEIPSEKCNTVTLKMRIDFDEAAVSQAKPTG